MHLDLHFDLEFAPTHMGETRLTPFERYVLVALHGLEQHMTKTSEALAALNTTDANLATLVETVIADVTILIEDGNTKTADAVAAALKAAGVDDDTIATAVNAAKASDDALAEKLTSLKASVEAVLDAPAPAPVEPAPEPAPAEPTPVTFQGPTSIIGASGTPVSGTFTASGGSGSYKFAQDGALGDFQTTDDGFYAMNPTAPATGTVNITVTDSDGNVAESVTVTISIS